MKMSCAAVAAIAFSAGAAVAAPSVERGEYLVQGPMGCGNCHTPIGPNGFEMDKDLAGRMVEDLPELTAISANITPAGRVSGWSDAELGRAIRECIRPDGSLIGPPMPCLVYRNIGDDDLASIVAYLRSIPAVDHNAGTSEYRIPLPPAYGPPIDSVTAPPPGMTVEYGQYIANLAHCMECHSPITNEGPQMDAAHLGIGTYEFEGPWGVSVAPNITSHDHGLAGYSDEEIKTMIRQGKRPDGSAMLPPMPYHYFARMTDEDTDALVIYLRSVPPLPDP